MKFIDNWQEHALDLGNFPLQSGEVLVNGRLHYHQFGALNAPKSNLILMPTYYGGRGVGNRPWVDHPSSPLQGGDYCVIIPCMFGAGESSSPSNTGGLQAGPDFPAISLADNVRAHRELIKTRFADAIPRLVIGWSMGGMQALQWAQLYPDRLGSLLAICATAKCYPHNQVFLEGVASALMADAEFANGHYTSLPRLGLTAFAKVYAGWAYSQSFYRDGLYRKLGFESIDELLSFWVDDHLAQDANDLLTQLNSWKTADIAGAGHMGKAALKKLRCPGFLMPSSSDLYFTEADAVEDAAALGAQVKILESEFGHVAGGPGRLVAETETVFRTMEKLLRPE